MNDELYEAEMTNCTAFSPCPSDDMPRLAETRCARKSRNRAVNARCKVPEKDWSCVEERAEQRDVRRKGGPDVRPDADKGREGKWRSHVMGL
jgi:hypothetical protein